MSYLRFLRALVALVPTPRPRGRHSRCRLRRAAPTVPCAVAAPPLRRSDGLDDLRAELAPLVRELLAVRAEVAR